MANLSDPMYNLKEVCKQLLLLEDHLTHPEKMCPDCIRKHTLLAEALAEEAISLGAEGDALQHARLVAAIMKKPLDPKVIRGLRKRLVAFCYQDCPVCKRNPEGHSGLTLAIVLTGFIGYLVYTSGE